MTNSESTNLAIPPVSVVVAVYNSEATLVQLVDRLHAVFMSSKNAFEIILVNDGSFDNSWSIISDLVAKRSFVRGINLMRNYGQHNALLAGILQVQHEFIVTLDDDLQHPPEEIPKLLAKLSEGYDIVFGKPVKRNHRLWRNIASKVLSMAMTIVVGAKIARHRSSFRAFRSILLRGVVNFTDPELVIDVLLSWSASRVTHVTVDHHPRACGKSGYTLRKLFLLSFNLITGYSTLPLRIASAVGLTTSLFGLVMFFYVVIKRLLQATYVPGFAFLASEIALFSGMLLFAIGVIGEYLARLHFRTMGKPPYVIKEEVGAHVSHSSESTYPLHEDKTDKTLSI